MKFNKYFCNEEIIYIMGTSMVLNTIGFYNMEPGLSSFILTPFKYMALSLFTGRSYYNISKKEQLNWYNFLERGIHRYWVRLL